jgi:hypothetical protein
MNEDDFLKNIPILPDHESGLRRMIADSKGMQYHAFQSFLEAKSSPDSIAVFEGDYGGQIYLVARVSRISCSEQVLVHLLSELDSLAWKDTQGAGLFFEEAEIGQSIPGGMGGGIVTEGTWIHSNLQQYSSKVEDILTGKSTSLFSS